MAKYSVNDFQDKFTVDDFMKKYNVTKAQANKTIKYWLSKNYIKDLGNGEYIKVENTSTTDTTTSTTSSTTVTEPKTDNTKSDTKDITTTTDAAKTEAKADSSTTGATTDTKPATDKTTTTEAKADTIKPKPEAKATVKKPVKEIPEQYNKYKTLVQTESENVDKTFKVTIINTDIDIVAKNMNEVVQIITSRYNYPEKAITKIKALK